MTDLIFMMVFCLIKFVILFVGFQLYYYFKYAAVVVQESSLFQQNYTLDSL